MKDVNVLREALPFIRRFRGSTFVVKMVFAGKLNTEILGALRRAGVRAVGLSGVDADLLRARRRPPQDVVDTLTGERRTVDFGFVGDILEVDPAVLVTLASGGFVPVIASLAADDEGTVYNVNADTVASAIARSIKAEKLIIATNVPGLLGRDGEVVSHLTADEARALISEGVVRGGMIPKIEASLAALAGGCGTVHLVDGTRPGALLDEVFTTGGNGTMLEAEAVGA